MNLLDRKLWSAVILLHSLFFVSCEDPGKIGLNLDPKQGSIITKYQEFTLPSSEVQFDPRSTVNSSSVQAGRYTDPDFGIITSKTFSWLGVQSSTPTVSETAVYDSIKISLKFSSVYGSETLNGEIGTIELYQLGEVMDSNTEYTRLDEIPLGQKIGSLDLYLQDNDTLQTDSTFTFNLSNTFGQDLFSKLKANDGTYDDDATFNSFFKGIAFVPSATSNKIIQLNYSTILINMSYHEINTSGESVKRTYSFGLGSTKFYHIDSDLSGTSLSGIQPNNQDFIPSSDYRFMQSGTLIGLKLDYNDLLQFTDTIDNLVIQRAQIKIGGIEENVVGSGYPISLKGYFTDENNTWPIITDFVSSIDTTKVFVALQEDLYKNTVISPGTYLSGQDILLGVQDTTTYEATVSNFLQNIANGGFNSEKTPNEMRGELILFSPSDASLPQSSSSLVLTKHFKVHKDSIKLQVYYTVPN